MNVAPIILRLGGSFPLFGFQEMLSSHSASLRGLGLSFSSWLLLQSSSLLYLSSVSILAFTSWLAHSRPSVAQTTREEEWTNDAISILAKALIPTQSSWYPSYVDICRRAARRMKRRVFVPANGLFRDITQGRIELRSPVDDLSLLMGGAFEADDWSIRLQFSIKDRLSAALWLVEMELAPGITTRSCFNTKETERTLMGEPESVIFHAICAEPRLDGDQILLSISSHRSSFFPSDMGSSKKHETASDRPTYFRTLSKSVFICPPLDCVSRYHIHDFLHSFQVAFRSDKRTLAYLSFTTCEKAPPLLSFKHMCISKLFMPKHKRNTALPKTSSPLFCRFNPVLECLTSGPNALTMCNTQNVSFRYAVELDQYAERLACDPVSRFAFVKKFGIQVWREERLYLSWESALLKEGLISRWVLLLGK